MQIGKDTEFHWRNYLKATPPTVYWLVTTAEAIILAVNIKEIFSDVSPWWITSLLILQTGVAKLKDFIGKINDEYQQKQKVTITATGDVEVKEETIEIPKE